MLRERADPDLSHVAATLVDQMGGGVEASLVWVNPLTGRTYRLEAPAGTQFLKLSPDLRSADRGRMEPHLGRFLAKVRPR